MRHLYIAASLDRLATSKGDLLHSFAKNLIPAYAEDALDPLWRAAANVDLILETPDLPVQQPPGHELVINPQSAKSLGNVRATLLTLRMR